MLVRCAIAHPLWTPKCEAIFMLLLFLCSFPLPSLPPPSPPPSWVLRDGIQVFFQFHILQRTFRHNRPYFFPECWYLPPSETPTHFLHMPRSSPLNCHWTISAWKVPWAPPPHISPFWGVGLIVPQIAVCHFPFFCGSFLCGPFTSKVNSGYFFPPFPHNPTHIAFPMSNKWFKSKRFPPFKNISFCPLCP